MPPYGRGRGGGDRSARSPGGFPEPPGDPEQPLGDPEAVARSICLSLLDRRACSRAELADKLARRGVPDDAAGTVLDRFTEVGLIDDAGLASMLATSTHRERGLARRGVAEKLRQRGIDAEVAGAAIASIDAGAERTRAEQLVAHRLRSMSGVEDTVRIRRLVGMLARKGYSSSMAYDVVRSALRLEHDPDLGDEVR